MLYIIMMAKVATIRWSDSPLDENPDKDKYLKMLDEGIAAITGMSAVEGLKSIIPQGRVGIKTNCLAKRYFSTSPAIVEALGDLLKESVTDDNDIVVWDRTNSELERAGFKLNASSMGRRCFGTDSNGVGYGRKFYSYGKVNSLLTRIMTDYINYNINVPILKDHSIAGLSGGLKNMYGAIHNPNKYHDNNCSPFAAHVSALDPVRDKNRLTVIDAGRLQYNAGPGYNSRYVVNYGGLIFSTDPVAADRVALELIEKYRKDNGLPSLEKVGRSVKYLAVAKEIGLGTDDWGEIELIEKVVGG